MKNSRWHTNQDQKRRYPVEEIKNVMRVSKLLIQILEYRKKTQIKQGEFSKNNQLGRTQIRREEEGLITDKIGKRGSGATMEGKL